VIRFYKRPEAIIIDKSPKQVHFYRQYQANKILAVLQYHQTEEVMHGKNRPRFSIRVWGMGNCAEVD